MKKNEKQIDLSRRDFLRGGSVATLMTMLGGIELSRPSAMAAEESISLPSARMKCAVIGMGTWGREITTELAKIPTADIAAICDTYPAYLRRGGRIARDAEQVADYRKILENKEIQAVIIATPTYQHKDLVLQSFEAGKHVYCEAPLAISVEDARAIALKAKQSPRQLFQAGLQLRSDKQRLYVMDFLRSGSSGKAIFSRAQWLKKDSWKRVSPNAEREEELNWRLDKGKSIGLIGEEGIHQLDAAAWIYDALPTSVSGSGSVQFWKDGRAIPDTTQVSVHFPGGATLVQNSSLATSFEREYEVYHGADGTVMFRGSRAWLFKEADAPAIGWEVYAKKESFFDETGISLRMDASKQTSLTQDTSKADVKTPLSFALENFLRSSADLSAAVEDFIEMFGDEEEEALLEHLTSVPRQPGAGYQEGYNATVVAIKAHEAVMGNGLVELDKELFELS